MIARNWLVQQWLADLNSSPGRALFIRGPWAAGKSDYLTYLAVQLAASEGSWRSGSLPSGGLPSGSLPSGALPSGARRSGALLVSGKRLLANIPGAALADTTWLVAPAEQVGPGELVAEPVASVEQVTPEGLAAPGDSVQTFTSNVDQAQIIVADDCQHLDLASAHQIADAVTQQGVTLIAGALDGALLPEPFRNLLRSGRADSTELTLMSHDEIRATIQESLGAPASPEIVTLIGQWTAGRPRWILPALDVLMTQGDAEETSSGWRLVRSAQPGGGTHSDQSLGFLGFLSDLEEEAKAALDQLVSWGPARFAALTDAFGPQAIKRLQAIQVAVVEEDALGSDDLLIQINGDMLVHALRQRVHWNQPEPIAAEPEVRARSVQRLYLTMNFEQAAALERTMTDPTVLRDCRSARALAEAQCGQWGSASEIASQTSGGGGQGAESIDLFEFGMQESASLRVGPHQAATLLKSARDHATGGQLHAGRQENEWVLAAAVGRDSAAKAWSEFLARTNLLSIDIATADWDSASMNWGGNRLLSTPEILARQGTECAVRAIFRVFQGLFRDALIDAAHAMRYLEEYDPFVLQPVVAAVAINAATRLDDDTELGSFLDYLNSPVWAAPAYPFLDITAGLLRDAQLDPQGAGKLTGKLNGPLAGSGTECAAVLSLDITNASTAVERSWLQTLSEFKRQLHAAEGLNALLVIAGEAASRNLFRVQRMAYDLAEDRGYKDHAISAARSQMSLIESKGIAQFSQPASPIHHDSLSAREREIATLAARSLSAATIASRLRLSARTVEGHIHRAYRKLGVHTRAELKRALEASIVSFAAHQSDAISTGSGTDPLIYAPRLLGIPTESVDGRNKLNG